MAKVTSTYEHHLQAAYHAIEKRGLHVNLTSLDQLRSSVTTELDQIVAELSDLWHENLSIGKKKSYINIRSNKQLPALLKAKGFKIPTVPPTKSQRDRGDTDHKESVGKLPLQLLFLKTGDVAIKKLLTIAELVTLKSRYINARLYQLPQTPQATSYSDKYALYLSSYNVAGTLTGRRSSNKNIFGYGGNGQNFPEHTESAKRFLRCIEPKPGCIFLSGDQKSAEEWPVAALCRNRAALEELERGVDRHTNLASFIFAKPVSSIGKKSMDRYLGKKSRHANNYGMQAKRMSLSLAQEGFFIAEDACRVLLEKVNKYDPTVRGTFHPDIRGQISKSRSLQTPFGRERFFMGFRPNASNNDVFGEAFAYIPQSVVGDNTGFSVLFLESNPVQNSEIVQESHDSINQQVVLDEVVIWAALQNTLKAFDREIDFNNGFKFKIPVEFKIGFNLYDTVELKSNTREGLATALAELEQKKESQNGPT